MDQSIFLSIATFAIGVFLGFLNNILVSKKKISKNWHWGIYVLYIGLIVFGIIACIIGSSAWGIALIIMGAIALWISYYMLNKLNDNLLEATKLVPQVIEFTEKAKLDEIRLLGGDLNFFGENPSDMDTNEQYIQLRNKNFDKISILCKKPQNKKNRVRYGKILSDFGDVVEFRYYTADAPDPQIRGRIKKKLSPDIWVGLLYERVNENQYRTFEEDISEDKGSLVHLKFWELLWRHSHKISKQDKEEILSAYNKHS